MDDNAPVHRARAVSQYLENSNIHHTEWPAQSPDINPIENIWLKLKRDIEPQAVNIHTQIDLLAAVHHSPETCNQPISKRFTRQIQYDCRK